MTDETTRPWSAQSEAFNFVAFARDVAYRRVNRDLIARALARLPSRFVHVDVASGTGLVPQEVCALCEEQHKAASIIGLDPDPFALEKARKQTRPGLNTVVEFVQGVAQDMARLLNGKIPREGADYTSIHDAIHEIQGEEDKRSVLASMARILRPGGTFTLNSAFTTAAMEGSAMEWGRLKAKAFAVLGGKRDRTMPAFAVHTPEEYRQMILDAGLSVVYEAKRAIEISRTALVAICRYPAFIEGVFCDMRGQEQLSLEEKSRALLAAIEALSPTSISRVWYEVLAQRRPA